MVVQLAQIERRQARIRHIRQKLAKSSAHTTENRPVPDNPEAHHHIGVDENHPQRFGLFLQSHSGDPALTVSFSQSHHIDGWMIKFQQGLLGKTQETFVNSYKGDSR
jgi:hypothetical protein